MPIPDQTALVKKIKDELIAKGQTFTTNCDAFQITGRVAWALRGQSAMLIVKTPGQNGCTWTNGVRYSHDAIAFSDGWVDCLEGAGPPLNTNQPSWQWHPNVQTGPLAAPFTLEALPLPEAHKYIGGGNDTGIVTSADGLARIPSTRFSRQRSSTLMTAANRTRVCATSARCRRTIPFTLCLTALPTRWLGRSRR